MRANALLVRYDGGWLWVEDVPSGQERIEATLQLGTVRSSVEAERIAEEELARFRDGQTEITVGVDPSGDDVPFVDYNVGDLVDVDGAARRLIALTVATDKERPGRLTYVPQFGDIIETPRGRLARIAKKMSNGTLGGASRAATPTSPPPVLPESKTARTPVQRVTQAEYDALDPVLDGVLYAIVG